MMRSNNSIKHVENDTLPVVGVLFSCDRAMQLDATLRSMFLHCLEARQIPIKILYLARNELHRKQYAQLQREYGESGNIQFFHQLDFRADLMGLLFNLDRNNFFSPIRSRLSCYTWRLSISYPLPQRYRYIMFLVDDNCFTCDFSICTALEALDRSPDALGYSLRLGKNRSYSYVEDTVQSLPVFTCLDGDVLVYDWNSAHGDFGYPLEVSSSIYRSRDLLPLLASLDFDNPNSLESQMAANAERFMKRRPRILCFRQAVTFCNPINTVQSVFLNRAGTVETYSSESLSELFERGYRINVETFSGIITYACHQEVEPVFIHTGRIET